MAALVAPQVERTNFEHTNILRWEDDGGQAIEYRHPADRSKPEAVRGNNQPITLPAKEEFATDSR